MGSGEDCRVFQKGTVMNGCGAEWVEGEAAAVACLGGGACVTGASRARGWDCRTGIFLVAKMMMIQWIQQIKCWVVP